MRSGGSSSRTTRLRIVPLVPDHAGILFEDLRDPALYQFIADDPPLSSADLKARFDRWHAGAPAESGETWCNWIMLDLADGRPVGTLQATLQSDGRAAIAYMVVSRRWGEGFGREGVEWMLASIARWSVSSIEARIDTRNAASIRLVEALGFQRTRTVRAADHVKGAPSDEHVYQRVL